MTQNISSRTANLLILVSAVCFGCLAMFAKLGYSSGLNPTSMLALRFTIASLVLAPIVIFRGVALPRGRRLAGFIALGLLYTAQSQTYFNALLYASSGLVGLLLYLYPLFVTAASGMLGWERPSRVTLVLLAVALCGIGITLGQNVDGRPLGIALAILAATIYSGYILLSKRVAGHDDPLGSTLVVLCTAAVGNVIFTLPAGPDLPSTALGWFALSGVAVISTVIAIAAFLVGVSVVGPARASVISTIEPIVTIGIGASLFGEALGAPQIIGALLVLGAVFMLGRHQHDLPAPTLANT